TVDLNGGLLAGSGTVNGSVTSSGHVAPGGVGCVGTLTINGNYTQTAAGSLDIDLGGTAAGSQHDILYVAGPAALDGALNADLLAPYWLHLGDQFRVLNAGSESGAFASINHLGWALRADYDPSGLTLTVVVVPSSLSGIVFADFNDDGEVDF